MPRRRSLAAIRRALLPPIDWRRLRIHGGLPALVLVVILTLLYPLSLQQASWVGATEHLSAISLAGLLFGTLVGNGRLRGLRATALAVALGTVVVIVLTSLSPGGRPLAEAVGETGRALNTWMTQAIAGEAATDPSAFVLLLGSTVWAAAYVGAFALARWRRGWDLILISGGALLVNISLSLTPLLFDLVAFTFCALLLLARLHVVGLRERWTERRIRQAGEMDWRVLRGALGWTLVLVLASLFLPRVGAAAAVSNAVSAFEGPYQAVEAEWQRFFAGVSGPSRLRGVSFSESIRLGLAPNLSDRVVLTVEAPQGRFWRAMSYDFYTGVGWRVTETVRTDRVSPPMLARERMDATFTVIVPHGNLLFAPNEPVRVSIPHQFTIGDDPTFSSSVRAIDRQRAAGRYQVTSLISTATKQALREATGPIPPQIRQTYLQLPSSLPQRVRDKAREVTANAPTAYDKAEAIEQWLRTSFRYSTAVKAPPPGRDPIDFFLFDLKEDFCEYFASAMVVMLREVGVPARMVEGYTTGERVGGRFVVREHNAHAWVEVYFPRYGWIEFEPTPSETVFDRAEGLATGSDPTGGGTTPPGGDRPGEEGMLPEGEFDEGLATGDAAAQQPVDPRPAGLVLGAILLLGLAAVARFQWRFRGVPPLDAAWGKTRLLSAYAGVSTTPSQTAYEYAATLSRAVPEVGAAARTLAHLRVLDRYGRGGISDEQRREASRAWRSIARALLQRLPRRAVAFVTRLLR